MSIAWITLSHEWEFANVQATINIIISFLATLCIWTFSRLWYQNSAAKIFARQDVPMSSLFTITTIGEVWDVLSLMKGRLLRKNYIPLLFQTITVVLVTIVSILSGPIARYSLRTAQEVLVRPVDGLLGAAFPEWGPYGNMMTGNVLWNKTLESLSAANFPTDQLLDYLPSLTVPWVYNSVQWNATWTASCKDSDRTYLNITANQNYSIYDPIHAFPEFGKTFDPMWMNRTQYRYSADLCGWEIFQKNGSGTIKDFAFFVLLETEPTIDGQMYKNNGSLHISLTVLHVRNALLPDGNGNFASGPAELSDYTRTECVLTRRVDVPDTGYIAWPWTNGTDHIVAAFADYYRYNISLMGDKRIVVPPLTPKEIFRFYQAYMISYLVLNEYPIARPLSVLSDVIQLSTVTLVIILFLFVTMVSVLSRYAVFRTRNSKALDAFQVPEAKLDWILFTFKNSRYVIPHEMEVLRKDLFADAVYGQEMTSQTQNCARVYSRRQSAVGVSAGIFVPPGRKSSNELDNATPERSTPLAQEMEVNSATVQTTKAEDPKISAEECSELEIENQKYDEKQSQKTVVAIEKETEILVVGADSKDSEISRKP